MNSHDNQAPIKSNTRYSLFKIYGAFESLNQVHSNNTSNNKLILNKIRKGEILKNDSRFNQLRTGERENTLVQIRINEADNEWFKETAIGKCSVFEKRELFRLRAEVSERVEQRKAGVASILDFLSSAQKPLSG